MLDRGGPLDRTRARLRGDLRDQSAFGKMRGRINGAEQTVIEGDVEIDGDRATGSWQIHEAIVDRDGSERERVGRYDDEYRRTRDGWKFTRRAFTPAPAAT